jgi:BASS family bile acid:Na+ symporter
MVDLAKLLISGANAAVVVFVVSSTLGVGVRLTIGQILTPLRDGRLVALSLLANFVLSPLAAIAIASVLRLDEPLRIGLLLCGVAAGAPFVLKLAEMAKGNMAFAVGLMVVLMVTTVGYMPLFLPMLLAGVSVDGGKIAQSLIVLMLIPLALGLAVRAWLQPTAARLAPLVGSVSSVAMILVILLTTAAHFPSVISVVGTFAILAAVVFTAVCLGIGWVLGGPAEGNARRAGFGNRSAQHRRGVGCCRAELQRRQGRRDDHRLHDRRVRDVGAAGTVLRPAADTAQLKVGATAGR